GGTADEGLAVAQGEVDVRAAAELDAEEDVHGVGAFFGEVNDGGVEGDDVGFQRGDGGEDGAEDAGVDDARGHRAALVHAEYDVLQRALLAAVADAGLGDNGLVLVLVVLQVGADGAVPVDLVVAGAAVPDAAADGAGDGLAH